MIYFYCLLCFVLGYMLKSCLPFYIGDDNEEYEKCTGFRILLRKK